MYYAVYVLFYRCAQVCNMFIVSLAIADLIVGLLVMPISAVYVLTVDWPFGLGLCQFWIAVDYTASTASILNLFVLSLDRYWSVTAPLKYLRKRTRGRGLLMITMVTSGLCQRLLTKRTSQWFELRLSLIIGESLSYFAIRYLAQFVRYFV